MENNKIPEGFNKAIEIADTVSRVIGMIPKIICFLVGLVAVGIGVYGWWEDASLKRQFSARTDGVVINVEHSLSSKKEDIYTFTYKYSVEGAEHVKTTSSTTSNPQFSVSDSATVFYDPSNPERCYVAELRSSTGESNMGAIIFIVVGCLLMLLSPWANFGRVRRR